MDEIAIEHLQPGMMIVAVTAQNGPVRIRKSGMVSSWDMVQGLKEMGVQRLQIDLQQSVEIETDEQPHHSPVQQLLSTSGQHRDRSRADGHLHDQFNRSLFLPSVSGLHSRWRHYLRQSALWSVLIAGGLAIGFTVATPQRWVMAWHSEPAIHQPVSKSVVMSDKPIMKPPVKVTRPKPSEAQSTGRTASPVSSQPVGQPVKSYADQVQQQPQVAVSPDLVKKFNQAVEAVGNNLDTNDEPKPAKQNLNMPDIHDLPPDVRRELPKMSFSAHMYSSEPKDRWVRMNGRELHEGDWINSDLQLKHITPQQVIMSFRGQQFSMDALSDW